MDKIINQFLNINIFNSENSSIIHAKQGHSQCIKIIKHFLNHYQLLKISLDSSTIEYILFLLSNLDLSNSLYVNYNFKLQPVFSNIISKRQYRFGYFVPIFKHLEEKHYRQLGTSYLCYITNRLALHAIKLSGVHFINYCCVIPLATGMTLALCMRSFAFERTDAKYVIWCRIDQKSCFKSILTAGFIPIIIQNILLDNKIITNLVSIEEMIRKLTPKSIVCVCSTTSCFAPRCPDNIVEIGKICKQYNIPHLVNNAYGLQSTKCSQLISDTVSESRLDLFVSSTDKNFMVPVGGSIIAGPSQKSVKSAASLFQGKGAISPIIDLFITLLNMGETNYSELLLERPILFEEMKNCLRKLPKSYGLEIIETPSNYISLAISLDNNSILNPTRVGQRLFQSSVSGCRLVKRNNNTRIENYEFKNWGSHFDNYPFDYLCCAVSIGIKSEDVKAFISRLTEILNDLLKEKSPVC